MKKILLLLLLGLLLQVSNVSAQNLVVPRCAFAGLNIINIRGPWEGTLQSWHGSQMEGRPVRGTLTISIVYSDGSIRTQVAEGIFPYGVFGRLTLDLHETVTSTVYIHLETTYLDGSGSCWSDYSMYLSFSDDGEPPREGVPIILQVAPGNNSGGQHCLINNPHNWSSEQLTIDGDATITVEQKEGGSVIQIIFNHPEDEGGQEHHVLLDGKEIGVITLADHEIPHLRCHDNGRFISDGFPED